MTAKRYIAQFVRGGFPEQYAVLDTHEGWQVSEPKPYHEANDEAEARNAGTFGQVSFEHALSWAGLAAAPQPNMIANVIRHAKSAQWLYSYAGSSLEPRTIRKDEP